LIGLAWTPTDLSGPRPAPFRRHRVDRRHSSAECQTGICRATPINYLNDLAVPALGAGYSSPHASGGQHMSRYIAFAGLCIALFSASPVLADPNCDGPESWPAAMTHAQLKNDGVLVNDEMDFSRTAVQQIASQRMKKNLYRQVFKIVFHLKNGRLVQAIAVSDASKEECSMSHVTIYRIADPTPE
jgi:hypothetical protein